MKTPIVLSIFAVSMFASFADSPPVALPQVVNGIEAPPIFSSETLRDGSFGTAVLASDGVRTGVILDGSASYDPDQNQLQFFWYRVDGGEQGEDLYTQFAEGVRTTNSFSVGYRTLALGVFDGTTLTIRFIYLDVFSPTMVLQYMRDEVEDEGRQGPAQRLLLHELDKAIRHFTRGQTHQGLQSLAHFRRVLHHHTAGLNALRIQALDELSDLLLESRGRALGGRS